MSAFVSGRSSLVAGNGSWSSFGNAAFLPHNVALDKKRAPKQMSYEGLETGKRCHATLCEKADPLKALGSVASYLGNGIFYLINDMYG